MGYRIALLGNPNCGKSTLFNALTGMNVTVGNRSGVTVSGTEAHLKGSDDVLVDLPGVYALSSESPEEVVAHVGVADCDVIVNVLDGTNLLRGLRLTALLFTFQKPIILAVNMMDELSDGEIDVDALASLLACPAIGISAAKGEVGDLLTALSKIKSLPIRPRSKSFSFEEIAANASLFCHYKPNKRVSVTARVDKILLNKYLAYPIFFVVMTLVYGVSIVLGGFGKTFLENAFISLSRYLSASLSFSTALTSLFCDGIIVGVGSVISFLPQLLLLFFFISLLEGCGYMARIAYIMDKLLRKIGLSGKSFIPLLIGCSCTVPAVMSARTVEDIGERRLTVLLTPFVPCSAKLPAFFLIASSFFPLSPIVAPSMYFLSVVAVITCGYVLKMLGVIVGEESTFILDLPLYRVPRAKTVALDVFEKAKHFLIKAGTVIFALSILLWALQNYNVRFEMTDIDGSILASVGKTIAPLFAPLGFGQWELAVSLLTGAFAKESIVSTLAVLTTSSRPLTALTSPYGALSFMVFVLLSFPCVASLATIRSELGGKWLAASMLFQFGTAYAACLLINTTGMLLAL